MNDTTITVGAYGDCLRVTYRHGLFVDYPDTATGAAHLTQDILNAPEFDTIELLPDVPQNLRRLWDKANSAFSVSTPWAQDVHGHIP